MVLAMITPARLGVVKQRLHDVLEIVDSKDRSTRIFSVALFSLIILNAVAVIIETTSQSQPFLNLLADFERTSMVVFVIEYLLRIWVCDLDPRYSKPVVGRLRFMVTPLALIDLATVLPFLLHLTGVNLATLRVVRMLRLLKFARLVRYSAAFRFITASIISRKHEFLISFFLMLVMLLVASSLMYLAEHEAQPQLFSSIPATFWWGVVTFTSVGYGDVFPVTVIGKILGGFFAIFGISVFALPTAILTAAMLDQMHLERLDGSRPEEETPEHQK